jgi:serine/threonine-protein kinase
MSALARPIATLRVAFDALLGAEGEDRALLLAQFARGDAAFAAELERMLAADARGDERGGIPNPLHDRAFARVLGVIEPGSQLGDYEVLALIGSGGMGRVYRARSRRDGNEIAIKLMRPEMFNDALRQRFSNERRVLESLDHPGICRFIDGGELDDGTPFVAMELIEGEPLLAYCDRLALGIDARLALFRRLLRAVAHAHHHLVVHRDIKGDNILVGADGQPKLLDFGIAKALDDGLAATRTAERFLSFGHAAPEQFSSATPSIACDVYALGILLYELLVGVHPFLAEKRTPAELQYAIEQVPPAALAAARGGTTGARRAEQRGFADESDLRSALAGDLDAIVQKCLRKAPGERYATVDHLDEELARYSNDLPVLARHGDRAYRLRKFVARHRWMVGGIVTFLLGALIAVGVVAAKNRRISIERDRAESALEILRGAFLGADPARVSGEFLTARQVLEGARPRLEAIHDAQPEVFAALGTTIAEVELGLGLVDRAAALSRRAVEAADAAGMEGAALVEALIIDARAHSNLGELDRAERSIDRAQGLSRVQSVPIMAVRAGILLKRNKPDEALQLLERSVRLSSQAPAEDVWADYARRQFVEWHRQKGENEAALHIVESSLARLRQRLDDSHPLVMSWRLIEAQALMRLGRTGAAEAAARQLRDQLADGLGARNSLVAEAELLLGSLHYAAGRYDEALSAFASARDVWIEVAGPTHPNALRVGFNLAQVRVFVEQEASPQTLELFRSVLVAGRVRFGAGSSAAHTFLAGYLDAALGYGDRRLALEIIDSVDARAVIGSVSPERRAALARQVRAARERAGCGRADPATESLCQNATEQVTATDSSGS